MAIFGVQTFMLSQQKPFEGIIYSGNFPMSASVYLQKKDISGGG